jgi:hypothetical protein
MDTDTNSNYPESPTEEDEVFLCKGCGEVRDGETCYISLAGLTLMLRRF